MDAVPSKHDPGYIHTLEPRLFLLEALLLSSQSAYPFPYGLLQPLHLCLSVGSMPRVLYFFLFRDSMNPVQSSQCQSKLATGICQTLS